MLRFWLLDFWEGFDGAYSPSTARSAAEVGEYNMKKFKNLAAQSARAWVWKRPRDEGWSEGQETWQGFLIVNECSW